MKKQELTNLIENVVRKVLNEMDQKVKSFSEIKIGDDVYSSLDDEQEVGTILWKGTYQELEKSKYKKLIDVDAIDELDDYDLIVIDGDYGQEVCKYGEGEDSFVAYK